MLGIIQQSGGYIEVLSQPGQGATFKIYLPRIDQAADRVGSLPGTSSAPAGTETVLLVEDENLVLQIVMRGLQAAGYKVLEAPSRSEALALCKRARGEGLGIDLMLSDLVMPGMSAAEMAEQTARIQPGMKVLYMSGYPDRAVSHKEVLLPGTPFLQKPFTVAELLQKVREVLDEAQQRA